MMDRMKQQLGATAKARVCRIPDLEALVSKLVDPWGVGGVWTVQLVPSKYKATRASEPSALP